MNDKAADSTMQEDRRDQRLRHRAVGQRAFDLAIAGSLTLLAAPLWLLAAVLWALRLIDWTATVRLGEGGRSFAQYTWAWRRPSPRPSPGVPGEGEERAGQPYPVIGKPCSVIGRLPTLLNVLAGRMAIVGPRAVSPGDPLLEHPDSVWRFSARPGLVCLWWVRQRANIDYGSEVEADYEYVATRSLSRDIGIALRAVAAWLMGGPRHATADEIELLGLRIDNFSMRQALDEIVRLARGARPEQVCFLNADCVNVAWRNADYREALRQARYTLADGVGLKLAGKLLGREVRQNVNGTDLFPRLCEALAGTGLSIYLLGARPGVAESVAAWIGRHYPETRVAGFQHGYFTPAEEPAVIERIAEARPAVLLVAFGAPRQELWIHEHLEATGACVALGVGGLFDFYSGRIPRAPQWMRELCLEWLYRVYAEPRRLWKRYLLGNVVFVARAFGVRLFGSPRWADIRRRTPAPKPDAVRPRRRPVE